MRSFTGFVLPAVAAAAALLLQGSARANEADDILAKIKQTMTSSQDQVSTMKMILTDSDGSSKSRELLVKQKGTDLRIMKFVSPAEVKGVAFLVRSDEEMYLYMPEFGKVRRIASHVKNDTFMGTDFSYSDLGSNDYSDKYKAKLLKKEGKLAELELKPKTAADSQYGKLLMTVDLERYLPTRVQFFDKKGTLWKEMEQQDIKKIKKHWVPQTVSMKDHKKKHSTVIEMSDIKFDTGLKDKDFSKRKLKRSR